MSTHYTVLLSLPLNPVLAMQYADVLDFVLNADAPPPAAFPPHPFFEAFNPDFRLHRTYRDFPAGAWQSVFWREFAADHSIRSAGVNLCLPAQKLEGVWEESFPLLHWLATLSSAQGPVGMITSENHDKFYDFDEAFS